MEFLGNDRKTSYGHFERFENLVSSIVSQLGARANHRLQSSMFKDDDARLVVNAVKSLISTSTSSFAPTIGQIKNKMHSLTTANTEVSSLEAWEVVRKAISRSGWYAEEEFEKLPDDLKRLVGSASQLHNWSQMDSDTVNSVISSNFQRNYKQRAEREKELAMLPNDVKKALQIDEKQIFKQIDV